MKDVVYLNGLTSVESYLDAGGKLENLYIWKLHLDDIKAIQEHAFFTKHKRDLVIPFSV
jgi:hypothetical protein